jgi:hypothetical protein
MTGAVEQLAKVRGERCPFSFDSLLQISTQSSPHSQYGGSTETPAHLRSAGSAGCRNLDYCALLTANASTAHAVLVYLIVVMGVV